MPGVRTFMAAAALLAGGFAGCGGDDSGPMPTPTPRREATAEGASLPEWADEFCGVVIEFEEAIAVATPSADLPFEERKPRAIANFEVFAGATDDAVRAFGEIEAPVIALPLQRAATGQFAAIRDAYEAALVPLRAAETVNDIDAVNEELRQARDAAEQEYRAQIAFVSPAVATALGGRDCGGFAG